MAETETVSESIPETRRSLLKWGGWFSAANILLMCIVGLRYLLAYPWPEQADARIYAVTAYLGQFALLAYLPYLLIVAPVILAVPRKKVVFPVAVLIATVSLTLLLLDSLLFAENKFHINALTIAILEWKTWGFGLFYLLIIGLFQSMLAGWVWRKLASPGSRKTGILLGIFLFFCLLGSQLQYIWADAHYYVPVTKFHHYLPLYYRFTAKRLMARHGLVDLNQVRERRLVEQLGKSESSDLRYPLNPVKCNPPDPALNILIILADALRADVVTPEITPNIDQFSRDNIVFAEHFSGGNSSRMGVFSMFYSLPSSYWQSFKSQQRPSVLIDLLQKYQYQMGIFSSAPLMSPTALDRTAFAHIPNLRKETKIEDSTVPKNDIQINKEWNEWLENRTPDKPFFGFLFYDSAHAYEVPKGYPEPFVPAGDTREQVKFTAYKNSAHFVDSLIGDTLKDLAERKLLDSTIVLISSDHGEEFNENGNDYWRHGTSYSNYQIRTPMIIHWPGKDHKINQYRTSHYDIIPTLLDDALNCDNPYSDYSVGKNLFDHSDWQWIIAGSYNTEAIVEPNQITVTYPGGYFEIRDRNFDIIDTPVIHSKVITEAMKATGRYYK